MADGFVNVKVCVPVDTVAETTLPEGISMDVNGDMTLGGGIACADEVIGRPRFTD